MASRWHLRFEPGASTTAMAVCIKAVRGSAMRGSAWRGWARRGFTRKGRVNGMLLGSSPRHPQIAVR